MKIRDQKHVVTLENGETYTFKCWSSADYFRKLHPGSVLQS